MRTRLRLSRKLEVVAEGATGAEAVAAARAHRPDLMLLDVSMPVMDGLEALPHLRQVAPKTQVVMLSGFSEARLGADAEAGGAAGYLEKGLAPQALVDRLLEIVQGRAPTD